MQEIRLYSKPFYAFYGFFLSFFRSVISKIITNHTKRNHIKVLFKTILAIVSPRFAQQCIHPIMADMFLL